MKRRDQIRLQKRRRLYQQRQRRGVLMLVVLSMLTLFMMIGTAFLLTSSQFRTAARGSAKLNRVGNHPGDLLERALFQVLRDTKNPYSVVRYHSLLRDLYGVDGFQAAAWYATYARPANNLQNVQSWATSSTGANLGSTHGELIDIYVVAEFVASNSEPGPRNVIELIPSLDDINQIHELSHQRGYWNGAVLTFTEGEARGVSTRIVDFEFVGGNPILTTPRGLQSAIGTPWTNNVSSQGINSGAIVPRIWRLRVEAFANADGSILSPLAGTNGLRLALSRDDEPPAFIVNGKPFNGTGVGYDVSADTGLPRLGAMQLIDGDELPTALLPNTTFFVPENSRFLNPSSPLFNGGQTAAALATLHYGRYPGPGDADESYDAADYQNMALAYQTARPRSRATLLTDVDRYEIDTPPRRISGTFQTYDLTDVPIPSFHRPALVHYWYHRLVNQLGGRRGAGDDDVRGILDALTNNSSLSVEQRATLMKIKRRIMLRPLAEDHPNFTGSNPASRYEATDSPETAPGLVTQDATGRSRIVFPAWEYTGPWDVDNDNDGVPDSIWIDLGDPVQQAEDGTRYKPLYAIHIVDLDGRLNLNAHGSSDHILAGPTGPMGGGGQAPALAGRATLDVLPRGMGWGPADINLRGVFREPLPAALGNRVVPPLRLRTASSAHVDDYASLLAGRIQTDGWAVVGRHGFDPNWNNDQDPTVAPDVGPGPSSAAPDHLYRLEKFNYPTDSSSVTAFGIAPDLMGRHSIGIDYTGQPVYGYKYENRSLLGDTPYELDLADVARRDARTDQLLVQYTPPTVSGGPQTTEFYDTTGALISTVPTHLTTNDDAPFAVAEIERILRAHDADAGAVPSRLYELVDAFDPSRLIYDGRINGSLVTAQHVASINQNLVTTDSFDLPIPPAPLPDFVLNHSDADRQAKLRAFPPESLVDLIDERIRQELGMPPRYDDYHPLGQFYPGQTFLGNGISPQSLADNARKTRLERINAIIHGGSWTDYVNGNTEHFEAAILAPELAQGLPFNVNRPFGDGRDNGNGLDDNGNGLIDEPAEVGVDPLLDGIVDDPGEAGEPFLDRNVNGRFDGNDIYIDLNLNNQYDPPRDAMWSDIDIRALDLDPTNPSAGREVAGFDYQQGQILPSTAGATRGAGFSGSVVNLADQARQLYARHLYVLAMALMDADYVAPLPTDDPQLNDWFEAEKDRLTAAMSAAEADRMVRKKLTCKMLAQWAVNCADFSDADATISCFEYDENPWDGWGVEVDGPNGLTVMPLDGDPATDENELEYIDWREVNNNNAKVLANDGFTGPVVEQQTRGMVWGAERPELLMTETLAFHDRRVEDLSVPDRHGTINDSDEEMKDEDLDQRLRPQGSLFVEVYNPWSVDGQYPAEFYSFVDPQSNAVQSLPGIALNRLSNAEFENKHSPVWRMVVVEEWPEYRNVDEFDDQRQEVVRIDPATQRRVTLSPGYQAAAQNIANGGADFVAADPDFDQAFDVGILPQKSGTRQLADPGSGQPVDVIQFQVAYPYVEREFYFTTANSDGRDVSDPNFQLRIPDRSFRYQLSGANFVRAQTQRFVPPQGDTTNDLQIAPILPGRYAVIGSAGFKYDADEETYTTCVGRFDTNQNNTSDSQHRPERTRRIELRPNINPAIHQVLVDGNGGNPQVGDRENELINVQGTLSNITGMGSDRRLRADFYQPAVAIPVEGMNVSEPPWGYEAREYEVARAEAEDLGVPRASYKWNPLAGGGEGAYVGGASQALANTGNTFAFDIPFDTAPELTRNGTTPNYRVLHLQRLADPTKVWNPLPGEDGHNPTLVVNPYRTIDSMSVDLTVFNGTSRAERDLDPLENALAQDKQVPFGSQADRAQYLLGRHYWYFRSLERGESDRLAVMNGSEAPQRVLWEQERARVNLDDYLSGRDQNGFDRDRLTSAMAMDVPQAVREQFNMVPTLCDMVMEHSLGYGNAAYGALYLAQSAAAAPPPIGLLGTVQFGNRCARS